SALERMKRKGIPEQRQRLDILDRRPDHRGTGLCRSLRSSGRLAVAAVFAQEPAVDSAEHDGLARERNSRQTATSMARGFADEHHARRSDLLEVEAQIVAADRARVRIAGALRHFDSCESADECIEATQCLAERRRGGVVAPASVSCDTVPPSPAT